MSQAPLTPPFTAPQAFSDASAALAHIQQLYALHTQHLRDAMQRYVAGDDFGGQRVRGCYPFVRLSVGTVARAATANKRLSYGFVAGPGRYETTLTRPDLFADYYREQIELLLGNHQVPVEVGVSHEPIPVHFAFAENDHLEGDLSNTRRALVRDVFDLPDLAAMDDGIANGTHQVPTGQAQPLSLFTAPRVDYSLHRLRHYSGTPPQHFQNFVLLTNYQFYVDEFVRWGREQVASGTDGYDSFVEPGPVVTTRGAGSGGNPPPRLPQMPAYHLTRPDRSGITLINIGVGPANAKTMTDHVAVLRPHVWLMLGHCAGLRTTQRLGDYVLAHAYVRQDHVLDEEVPLWVPIPALAEVQLALEGAVADVTSCHGAALKRFMRTGTVASTDNRNWELLPHGTAQQRLSQSRAVALDMESATVAANGFRFRVPYGTLLCVSDKPLHGELKLPGMANQFYRDRVDQHLMIGIRALERLRAADVDALHSRKLRSFAEVAFQ